MRKTIALIFCCALAASAIAAQTTEKKKVVIRPGQGEYNMPVVWADGEGFEVFVPGFAGPRAFLGVTTLDLSDELRAHFGVPKDSGVMINTVGADSPAAKAGLKAGDIITAVDGKKVDSRGSLSRVIREKNDGDQVRIDFRRNGANQQAFATLVKHEGFAAPGFRFDADRIREPMVIAGEAVKDIAGWLASGELKSKEDVVSGLETFPETLGRLFSGENFGKLVLKIR